MAPPEDMYTPQHKPLSTPTHPRSNDPNPHSTPKPPSTNRLATFLFLALLTLITITTLSLAFTIYKIKDPSLTLNSISVLPSRLSSTSNLTLLVDVSVRNPNALTYYFKRSATSFYYKQVLVGVARGPQGRAVARGVCRMNVTVDVLVGKMAAAGVVPKEAVEVESWTRVGGYVKVLGLGRHHVDVKMKCVVSVGIANLTVLHQDCRWS